MDIFYFGGPGGIRTPEAEAKDLQSSPFDRSGTDPKWSHQSGLNRWPAVYKTAALPAELWWHARGIIDIFLKNQTFSKKWCQWVESNRRPQGYESCALPLSYIGTTCMVSKKSFLQALLYFIFVFFIQWKKFLFLCFYLLGEKRLP